MDTLVNHIGDYLGIYALLAVVLLGVGGLLAFDVLTAGWHRGEVARSCGPDHTRTVHLHDPWAGMDESGPELP